MLTPSLYNRRRMLPLSIGRGQTPIVTCMAIGIVALMACGEGSIGPVGHIGAAGAAGSATTGSTHATSSAAGTTGTATGGVSSGDTTGAGTAASTSGTGPGAGGSGGSGTETTGSGSGGAGANPGAGGSSGVSPTGAGGSSGGSGGSFGGGRTGGAAGSGPSTGAWRPFSDTSPWNTPIPQAPALDLESNALVADLAASVPSTPHFWMNLQEYSIPVFWADASTPREKVTVSILAGQGFGTGSPGSALVPVPAGAAPAAGTDRHLCIIDKQAQTEWGCWDASHGANGWTCAVAATSDLSATGVRPPKAGNPTWWTSPGARACGFPLIAGLITVEEIRKGKIEHALVMAYPHMRSHWYKPPASTAQATMGPALPTRGVPCGGRIQLDPSLDVNGLQLSTSGKIIARALQEYGAFVGDFSGAISLYADASPEALAAWSGGLLKNGELASLDLKRLRVLALGAMLEDSN